MCTVQYVYYRVCNHFKQDEWGGDLPIFVERCSANSIRAYQARCVYSNPRMDPDHYTTNRVYEKCGICTEKDRRVYEESLPAREQALREQVRRMQSQS
ncbi:hypothetical protein GLAREA_11004 [Glarea lozoyensis ATCC 20868]|uniref:Uncharacterized protein n=1 Tax=Glarea lozoyensis (strain ATCC 20868 / MF5171) TaxID=1116229 RepID=S3DC77_GLAL2|nr:uncharacterized protein GLAREA_11004 [Glarea lozoyensis ATCC 20868]EPE35305.1 hypothetical protein GLAREA_11004 [Glarea lozoyensis ATCC 20868]